MFFGVRLIRNPKSKWGSDFDYPQDRKDEGGTGSSVGFLLNDDDLDFGAADSLRMDGFLRVQKPSVGVQYASPLDPGVAEGGFYCPGLWRTIPFRGGGDPGCGGGHVDDLGSVR